MFFKKVSIIHLLLGVRGVEGVDTLSVVELLVGDHFVASALELSDPSHTNTFALHGFGSPENGLWHGSLESSSKNVFFCRSSLVDELLLWINFHYCIDNIWA